MRLEETVFDCTLTGGRKFASFVACKYAPKPVTRLSRKLLQSAKRPPSELRVETPQPTASRPPVRLTVAPGIEIAFWPCQSTTSDSTAEMCRRERSPSP